LIEATTITKRLHYTLEEVMNHLSDEEDDYDDPDEPIMMEGSDDDEFSNLEMDEMIMIMTQQTSSPLQAQHYCTCLNYTWRPRTHST
jgi:hypothetical protein